MRRRTPEFTVTGILGAVDERYGKRRLRLLLVDEHAGTPDRSWDRLTTTVPGGGGHLPYNSATAAELTRAGICGECWASMPSGTSAAAKARADRIIGLALELHGRRVSMRITPRAYSFAAAGQERQHGTVLLFNGMEPCDTTT